MSARSLKLMNRCFQRDSINCVRAHQLSLSIKAFMWWQMKRCKEHWLR